MGPILKMGGTPWLGVGFQENRIGYGYQPTQEVHQLH